jgi:hypothetical protein
MLANLLVVVIILGLAGYQFLKSNLVKSFGLLISAIIANIAAFNYFEVLGKTFANIEFIAGMLGKNGTIGWLQSAAFLVIYVLVFAILVTVIEKLVSKTVDMGEWPEKIGRVVFGMSGGLVVAGAVIVSLMTGPLGNEKLYNRYISKDITSQYQMPKPKKVLLCSDDFATGLFNKASGTSFSNGKSFALMHADFLNQIALTKASEDDKSKISIKNEISLPPKAAVWPAPEKLITKNEPNDTDTKSYEQVSGEKLWLARIEIKNPTGFTMSQLRLICKQTADGKELLSGKGTNIFPKGYIMDNLLIRRSLDQKIASSSVIAQQGKKGKGKKRKEAENQESETQESAPQQTIFDFAFSIPNNMVPVAVGFKQASIADIPGTAIAKEGIAVNQDNQTEVK